MCLKCLKLDLKRERQLETMKTRHPDREIYPVEIFTGTSLQAIKLKELLDEAHIYSFVRNEYVGQVQPWFDDPGIEAQVAVLIASEDEDDALPLVERFRNKVGRKDIN